MGNWAHYVHLQMRGKRCSCAMGDTIGLGFIGVSSLFAGTIR